MELTRVLRVSGGVRRRTAVGAGLRPLRPEHRRLMREAAHLLPLLVPFGMGLALWSLGG
jgi:hypothetical protein